MILLISIGVMVVISILCLLDTMKAPNTWGGIWGGIGGWNWAIWFISFMIVTLVGTRIWKKREETRREHRQE